MADAYESLSRSRSREDKANAWMEERLADYELTDAQMKWWNASLDEATSDEIDEIVKLYESAAGVKSLNPVMMQYVCKYWTDSYGQQKPDQLLLAAYRASLHLAKSSALELFSNVLTYIGRSSYQEEHPKSNGGLVLVLINEMEKVLSVAGWCLASGVVSKEQYASIVEQIFSDKIADISDLVFCISDVAVTCVVEEDLTEKDELVFLKCQNLYEIIDVRSDSVFECTTTHVDEEEASHGNEDEVIATSRNGQVEDEDKDKEDHNSSCGLWKSDKEWNTKGVEADFDTNLSTHSDVERLNEGVIFSNHQYLGFGQGQGYDGSKSMSIEYCIFLGENDSEVPSCKGRWKWTNIGILIVSIGKCISEFMFARSLLNTKGKRLGMYDRGGAAWALLLMMLLAPPHRAYTLAKRDDHIIRHERVVNGSGLWRESKDGRSVSNASFVERKTAASEASNCAVLSFDWGEDNPYTYQRQTDGEKPFTLTPGCKETQRCLFMPDDKTFNVIAAVSAVFPTFENFLSERSPSIEQVLANAEIVYDDKSIMNVQGIGTYKGPTGIGEYRTVLQFVEEFGSTAVTKYVAAPSRFFTGIEVLAQEKWYHLNHTLTTKWNFESSFYPCSIVRKREDLKIPQETVKAFSDSAKVSGTVDSVCKTVMEHCTGELQQYSTTEECISFLGSLPHHDQTCQDKYGEYSAMGSSFMCKYLHHFMIPFSPEVHCAHVGKGLPDVGGNFKCIATDCQKDAAKQLKRRMEPYSSCSERDMNELVQGIIYTLPFCLPSLEMQVCLSNCTQAINTYLGRFAESGVIDSCDLGEVLGSSRLLSSISVDAHVLFHLCSGDALLAADVASSLLLDGHSIPTCSGLNQYLGSGLRCLGWDWDDISQGMLSEWSAKFKNQRVTQSDDIATAECHVFTHLYTQYLNIQDHQILDHASNLMQSDIQIHPSGHPVILSHEQVSMAFSKTQSRDGMGGLFGHCEIPGKAAAWMQYKPFLAIAHDTDSKAHKLARKFVFSTMQGLSTKPTAPPARDDLFDERGLLDYDELLLSLGEEHFRALLGDISPKSDSFWTDDVIDDIRDITKASVAWFFPESWHRAQGYITGVAYAGLRQTLGRKLRDEFISLREVIEPLLPQFNVSASEYLAYDALIDALSAVPAANVVLTRDIVKFIRQNPCQMLPLWNRSPERFIIEYTRAYPPFGGFATRSSTSPMGLRYQIASANQDLEVFLNPSSFDPDRSDLDQVVTWNFIEGEGPSSHARSCPGRSFAVQFVASHAERYFPNDITCANNMKVHNGVELFEDYIDIADGSKLQVLKTSTGSNTLFLFLHGFPDIPQEFAPIISHLRAKLNADYWILDGWSTNKCAISGYAEQVASFITESKAKFQYEKIFLVGHGYGGLVGWVVAGMLSKDILSGFISFSPSPQIYARSLSLFPLRKVYFYNLMKPLIGSTYLSSQDFQRLDDALTNETFWPEYRDEYHQMWDEVGAHALTCVYRDNYDVVGGALKLIDLDVSEEDIEIDVLLISGEDDRFYPRKLYHASIGAIKPQRGQQLYHKEVYNASHHSILHDHSKEASHHIEMFARSVNRKQISLWSRITIPPQVHNSYYEEVSSDTTTFYVYILTFVIMLTGIIMELTIGPMLVGKLGFSVYLFAQVMAATINFGCFFAADLITLPLYTIGLFKVSLCWTSFCVYMSRNNLTSS
eukprot:scaffold3660_cov129-Skeletonema_dohrnii-CCMP3373.AAC.14